MGLVDYDSDSASEIEATIQPTQTNPSKKPVFQKVVDRANKGKILLNLPQTTPDTTKTDIRPAKRARIGPSGALFSGLNSFLPPPKNANKTIASSTQLKPRPGVNLRTSAAPGFSRDDESDHVEHSSAGLTLPPPKNQAGPTIPEEQKAAEDVKLVGKPMLFKPLSVTRNTKKKKTVKASPPTNTLTTIPQSQTKVEPPPKKTSLFSMHTEEPLEPQPSTGAYEPLFQTLDTTSPYAHYTAQATQSGPITATHQSESLDAIANDLNLSTAERRELFGRSGGGGGAKTATKVINFNMDKEYLHNEELRANGEQQIHNPVRAIQGGKHNLRQLVQNVQNQKEALEDSFAKGRSNRKEASSKYGW